ncbi:hypothetical protein E4U42_007125 [Claviceps africana]|uniref:Uncharacterized protein n=1 Tax=Claviceps africana TaxID=83212 RepID=A0A8K0NEQ0_9HYPO|nr:hypothetical protein E4U42_007125 [Claviceps africana]
MAHHGPSAPGEDNYVDMAGRRPMASGLVLRNFYFDGDMELAVLVLVDSGTNLPRILQDSVLARRGLDGLDGLDGFTVEALART